MIHYTDSKSGLTWKADFYAARLVGPGQTSLPPRIGDFSFLPLAPERVGLPEHPLSQIYPGIAILHYALVVPERYKVVSPGGKEGIAFWINYNGSDMSVSITSQGGRSDVAPINWEGEDAVAAPFWEWRSVEQNGQIYPWTNARGHGFSGLDGRDAGYDWADGTPVDIATMYDREKGRTAQSVFVPTFYEIGTARQTLPPDALMGTYSMMLYFPRPEAVKFARKLARFNTLLTPEEAQTYSRPTQYGGLRGGGMLKGGGFEDLGIPLEKSIRPEFEVTHGHEMRQHVLMPPMFPNFWQPAPSAVLVCWPVSEEQASALFRPNVPTDRQGFW